MLTKVGRTLRCEAELDLRVNCVDVCTLSKSGGNSITVFIGLYLVDYIYWNIVTKQAYKRSDILFT